MSEASGLAASWKHPGVFWTLNDSGNAPRLYAFDLNGRRVATVQVEGANNEDWEDLAVGPGPDGSPWLYISDTGDNERIRREAAIYRIPEPPLPAGEANGRQIKSTPAEKQSFRYSDGRFDVEALLVHPTSGEIVLVAKDYSGNVPVHRLPGPFEPGRSLTAQRVTTLDLTSLGLLAGASTGGAVSRDGSRLVLRTYVAGLEYDLANQAPLADFWKARPRVFPIEDGPQGEGITYRPDGNAFFTIGEGSPAVLSQIERRC